MKVIIFANSFKRAYKSLIRKHPELKSKTENILRLLAENPFNPLLQTHKLKGQLAGSWACTVEYNCRIVFDFIENRTYALTKIARYGVSLRRFLRDVPK